MVDEETSISAEVLRAKVLELQDAVAELRAEKREFTDNQDKQAQLERRLKIKGDKLKKLEAEHAIMKEKVIEIDRLRRTLASMFDLHEGDGWDSWRK